MAIHEVEDIFVIYAEDTIERIVKDLQDQRQSIVEKSAKSNSSVKVTLKKSYAVSVSLLINDIQNFANLYRAFRDANQEYFDCEKDSNSSSNEGKQHNDFTDEAGEPYVPVIPALSDAF